MITRAAGRIWSEKVKEHHKSSPTTTTTPQTQEHSLAAELLSSQQVRLVVLVAVQLWKCVGLSGVFLAAMAGDEALNMADVLL